MESGVVEADEVEAGGEEVDGREEVGRDVGGGRELEEGDLWVCDGDGGDVSGSEVSLVGREGDDDGDGEGRRAAVVEESLAQLHHGYEVAFEGRWIKNYDVLHIVIRMVIVR